MSLTRSLMLPSVAASGGRTYYRHSSDMGSVMCWYDVDGTYRETLILDMEHNFVQKAWGERDTDISDITNYTSDPFKGLADNSYILGSSSSTPSDYDGRTDDRLNVKFNWTDENTSEHNTDAMIVQYPSGSYAANFCRTISFPVEGDETYVDVKCDLPNMQTLVRIFCDRATIHSMDSSDTSDLWSIWFGGQVWSSSEYNSNKSWSVDYRGAVGSTNKVYTNFVIPTKDILATFTTSAEIIDEYAGTKYVGYEIHINITNKNIIGATSMQFDQYSTLSKMTYYYANIDSYVETTITRLDNGVSYTFVNDPEHGQGEITITQPLVTSSDSGSTVNFRITQRILGGYV